MATTALKEKIELSQLKTHVGLRLCLHLLSIPFQFGIECVQTSFFFFFLNNTRWMTFFFNVPNL